MHMIQTHEHTEDSQLYDDCVEPSDDNVMSFTHEESLRIQNHDVTMDPRGPFYDASTSDDDMPTIASSPRVPEPPQVVRRNATPGRGKGKGKGKGKNPDLTEELSLEQLTGTGRMTALVDTGSLISAIGHNTMRTQTSRARDHGHIAQIADRTPFKMGGIGKGSVMIDQIAALPIATEDVEPNVPSTLRRFEAQIVTGEQSSLPVIIGSDWLQDHDAVMIMRRGRSLLALPGEEGFEIEWPPDTQLIPMVETPDGHLAVEIDHFETVEDHTEATINLRPVSDYINMMPIQRLQAPTRNTASSSTDAVPSSTPDADIHPWSERYHKMKKMAEDMNEMAEDLKRREFQQWLERTRNDSLTTEMVLMTHIQAVPNDAPTRKKVPATRQKTLWQWNAKMTLVGIILGAITLTMMPKIKTSQPMPKYISEKKSHGQDDLPSGRRNATIGEHDILDDMDPSLSIGDIFLFNDTTTDERPGVANTMYSSPSSIPYHNEAKDLGQCQGTRTDNVCCLPQSPDTTNSKIHYHYGKSDSMSVCEETRYAVCCPVLLYSVYNRLELCEGVDQQMQTNRSRSWTGLFTKAPLHFEARNMFVSGMNLTSDPGMRLTSKSSERLTRGLQSIPVPEQIATSVEKRRVKTLLASGCTQSQMRTILHTPQLPG